MRVQGFIFNWPGKKQHAAILERRFKPHCQTTVINSDDNLKLRHPHWQHIGNDAYFTDQWNAALDRFDADVFVHIQADIWPEKVGLVLAEAVRYIRDFGVGVYAPNVDFSAHVYDRDTLAKVDNGVYEVPATDCCFWAITGEVIRHTPRVHPRTNKLGWGIEYMVGAVTRQRGLRLVRDYRFMAGHPKFSGYGHEQALREWADLKNSLDPALRAEMESVEKERENLIVKNTSPNPLDRVVNGVRTRASRQAVILQRRVMNPW
ncbi:MAG: hypothetical protein QOJ41_1389 [Acidobacteriaceae bacterium]|jgi:hypothetical protein|nr:hypothetical protein [Acidobacteriaceae bacterium]